METEFYFPSLRLKTEPEKWQDTFWCCPSTRLQLKICPCSHNKFNLEPVEFDSNISLQAESWHRRRTPNEQWLGLCKRRWRGTWLFRIALCGMCLQREVSEVKRQAEATSASCSIAGLITNERERLNLLLSPWHNFLVKQQWFRAQVPRRKWKPVFLLIGERNTNRWYSSRFTSRRTWLGRILHTQGYKKQKNKL